MATKKKTASTSRPKKQKHTMLVMDGEELRASLVHAKRDDVIECVPGTYVLDGPPIKIQPGVQLVVARKTGSNVGEHFSRFMAEWTKLPPLVRAGMASGVVERMGVIAAEHDKRIELFQRLRLERRAEVLRRFTHATGAIQALFAALCLEADAEATERGIDLDVQPDPDTQFALGT